MQTMIPQDLIPTGIIAGLVAEVALTALFPIVLLIIWRRKTGAAMLPALAGAVTFFLVARVLEMVLHYFVLVVDGPLKALIYSSPWAYVAYGALAAGLFEETGRLCCFGLMKKHRAPRDAITYGIGHGGFEAISVVSLSVVGAVLLAVAVNSAGGLSGYLAVQPADKLELAASTAGALFAVSGDLIACGVIERVFAVLLHIALSVFVFKAVLERRWIFFAAAILLHAGANIAPGLYQYGALRDIYAVEVIFAIYTIAVCALAHPVYRGLAGGRAAPAAEAPASPEE